MLSPPSSPLATGELFQFQKSSANGDPAVIEEVSFLGYDLYYKIYKNGSSIDVNILTIEELQSKFRRLTSYHPTKGVLASPLVPISLLDRQNLTSFRIAVDFSGNLTEPTRPSIYSISGTPDPPNTSISIFDFRRGVTYPSTSETKRFAGFSSTDADISADIWTDIDNGSPVWIAVYVVSYGLDATYGPLYSIPLYLTYIQLTLPHS